MPDPPPPSRHLFVTTGATAPFHALVEAVVTPRFLAALRSQHFTHLTVQAGAALDVFDKKVSQLSSDDKGALNIKGFAFNQQGLGQEMKLCQASQEQAQGHTKHVKSGARIDGCVVSHAGTGSILDAMRLNLRLIVVPNPSLLDNHQEDLAVELEQQGYVTKSDIEHLSQALGRAMAHTPTGTTHLQPASIGPVLDEVMGFEEDTRARLD